jgi:hypothetical protein
MGRPYCVKLRTSVNIRFIRNTEQQGMWSNCQHNHTRHFSRSLCKSKRTIHSWSRNDHYTTYILIRSFIHEGLYSPLLGPGLFFSSIIIFTQTVGLFGRVISLSQGRYLHTGQHKHRIKAHRHPCFCEHLVPPATREHAIMEGTFSVMSIPGLYNAD